MAPYNSNDTYPYLNPDTPMAFLPPSLAEQYLTGAYIMAAAVGIWAWDVLLSITDLIRIHQMKRAFTLLDLSYLLSRITTGGFLLTAFLLTVSPIGDCQRLMTATAWFSALCLPLNSSLFLFRIIGVFYGSRIVISLFSFLWLSTFISFASAFTFKAIHIGPTQQCIIDVVSPISAIIFIVEGIYDTLVFLAISLKILLDSPTQGWKARTSLFFKGERIGHISKSLLQTGQLYYLIVVCGYIVALIVMMDPAIPIVYKSAVTVPVIALQNIMACRVVILLKLGVLKTSPDPFRSFDLPTADIMTSIQFNIPSSTSRDGAIAVGADIEADISGRASADLNETTPC